MSTQRQKGLEIVERDERWVVVNKPAGLLSVPGKGEANQDCVAARVREMIPDASGPMVVHRLDMDTSGLMILALDAGAQRELSRQFEERVVVKRYEAVVVGRLPESGVVEVPMRLDVERRPRQVVDFEQGRAARTEYRRVGVMEGRSRVELTPVTGRTHQLRVHMAHIGHPIVGDVLYGTRGEGERLMLHAGYLAVRDLEDGRAREFVCAVQW